MHEMRYALVRNKTVENIIVADDDFIQHIANDWEAIVRLDHTDETRHVGIGWAYIDGSFIAPVVQQLETE